MKGLADPCYTQSSSHCIVFLPKITIPWFCILFFKCKSHQIANFVILSWIFSKLCFFLRSETVLKKAFQSFYKHTHTHSVCPTQHSSFYCYLMSFYEHLISLNVWCSLLLYTSLLSKNAYSVFHRSSPETNSIWIYYFFFLYSHLLYLIRYKLDFSYIQIT